MPPSNEDDRLLTPASWSHGVLPDNVRAGSGTAISGEVAFKRFRSRRNPALVLGASCTMDGVQFAVGEDGIIEIGDFCYFTNAVLLCELALHIGNYVVIGWNTTIADTDFHPIAPAERIADAVACSPLGKERPRPPVARLPVVIGNDVWIGPNATVLKGVTIGDGARIEPGALVTRDVAPHTRVLGNPAQIVEGV